MPACPFGDCRGSLRNSQSVFLIVKKPSKIILGSKGASDPVRIVGGSEALFRQTDMMKRSSAGSAENRTAKAEFPDEEEPI